MKIKYILAAGFVALFAIPGTASQLAARTASVVPVASQMQTAALFSDPDVAPVLSITLPSRFVAADLDTRALQSFNG